MRIGIFGGSFNPPHKMHKDIVLNLLNKGYLDKIIIVPVGDNYNKKGLIKFSNRLDMLKLTFKEIADVEISNLESTGQKYTYEALDYFRGKYCNDTIYFICGSDNLNEINTWKNYKYIVDNYKIIVVNRNNYVINNIIDKLNLHQFDIIEADIDMNCISSTYIRELIFENDEDKLVKMIDKKVLRYILEKNLYNL